MKQEIITRLEQILTKDRIRQNEPMKNHTTFRVGGPADIFLTPSAEELPAVLSVCREEQMPVTVIGNGSNLLVGDQGIRGVVICIGFGMRGIRVDGEKIFLEAGVTLAAAAQQAAKAGLTGLEFASGIPGTFGGAVVMNAGAYGGEMKDVIVSVRVISEDGEILTLSKEELDLSYRHSVIPERGYLVIDGELLLTREKNPDQITERMEELKKKRIEKQPLEYPSAGSTFKRPEGYFAGKLIMDAGLRGFSVGGAAVSEKHCGFVINKGNATAADICALMDEVTRIVKEKYAVTLEPEVKKVGEF
ncbi:UDP-N-acetylmuramate dehydrogenase [Roseburia sp. BX0805]|uniref:UDP-N-acetylenolpyruvoylglucosamine reductase n=1 Tax=Roseburia yibonii TaxID=2763063 RepID=A0ABR7IBZ1_9FIRM|nr:UDP-N-acetylmuramate dehydrogenase [Roseburia yibonii]MBC5754442.1 UDP-N-acetylmuramate dehydrogenase [Roseburia yibonii]